jgi:vacuolar-type H+-ATPase subunit I/STV1
MSEESAFKSAIAGEAKGVYWPAIGLIVAGVLMLSSNLLGFGFMELMWPWFIVGIGLLLLIPAQKSTIQKRNAFSFMAIPGMVVVGLGGLLFVMTLTDHYESMAYSWILLLACGALGNAFWRRHDREQLIDERTHQFVRKTVLAFMVFAVLFELIIFQSIGPWWPVLIIGLGAYLMHKDRRSKE